ncbi:iron-containing redox enzyme family protein [Actinocrinis puniceicyclus]|uniref:Iron-containing redox enzyme family protein n=1 Tax=Actinocrinis puniceicyclus TaxID=977794 RepID=A0A8J7WPL0_9ACTN|nr:iron-containing redox enzyme family protein [Actinocrinis puniceicyclus]MBS2965148.1 iron-containing redox enzyme family protein [Actinocrinis puniceicyclus]
MSGEFVADLEGMIRARAKTTSPLYQTILAGKATQRLLRTFVEQRWPIKSWWTRNLTGVASRVEDIALRRSLIENAYEEEFGALSHSKRHVETFEDFGRSVGVDPRTLATAAQFPETVAVVEHNKSACNDSHVHFTAGTASVLLLMEGQPPIADEQGRSMMAVMRDTYELPEWGYEFFKHHASTGAEGDGVSELEDEHTEPLRELLTRYCDTPQLQDQARASLQTAIELRHAHFDAILREAYDPAEPVFHYAG